MFIVNQQHSDRRDAVANMNTEHCPAYRHERLQDPKNQIRLLRLKPIPKCDASKALSFDIVTYTLRPKKDDAELSEPPGPERISYLALSYVWGSAEKPHTIIVDGRPMNIGSNCHYALTQALSLETYISAQYVYWVDQICIDQENLEEKTHQVSLMGAIYKCATAVLCSVGQTGPDSIVVFEILENIRRLGTLPKGQPLKLSGKPTNLEEATYHWTLQQCAANNRRLCSHEELLETQGWVDMFMDRLYWRRMWILQELHLGDPAILMCGDVSAPLHDFAPLVGFKNWIHRLYTASVMSQISEALKNPGTSKIRIADIPALVTATNTKTPNHPFTEPRQFPWMMKAYLLAVGRLPDMMTPELCSIASFMHFFSQWGCTDPRDRVFGSLSISTIAWPETILPDYTISRLELAVRLIPCLFVGKPENDDWAAIYYFPRNLDLKASDEHVFHVELCRYLLHSGRSEANLREAFTRYSKLNTALEIVLNDGS